jgi:predicted dehydrogenase
MQPIRVGIIGAGANTLAKHIPGLQRIPGVELAVVCNRSEESSRRVAEAVGIPRTARHWREVAEAPDVDAVVIGAWPYLHAEATVAALDGRKHVLTEARMAGSLEEARRMWEASQRHPELVAQIVPAPFSLDVDETVRQLLGRGELGRLREVVVMHTSNACADAEQPLHWRQDARLSGVNVLSLGIVQEIVQRWLQDEEIAWVMSDGAVCTPSRADPVTGAPASVEIPDSLSVLGRFRSGARLVYHFSGVETGIARGEIRLNGSRGGLRFEIASGALFHSGIATQAETRVVIPEEARRGWRVEEDFIQSIRNNAPVRLTAFRDGIRYMRVVDAVWRSWKDGGRKIPLNE